MKFAALLVLAMSFQAMAKVKTENVEYEVGGTKLKGVVAYDDAKTKKPLPGILVFSNWMGNGKQNVEQAKEIAARGYVALAADVYGNGFIPKDMKEASEWAGKFRDGDRALLRAHAKAGMDFLSQHKKVDKSKLAAIGFCFGGTVALEMARMDLPLKGVVSFHGGLNTKTPAQANKIQSKVLALHGADDPFVPVKEVEAFEEEMRAAKADWQLVAYGNSVHSFTDKEAGNDPSQGQAYNPVASMRAFNAMDVFFKELFSK